MALSYALHYLDSIPVLLASIEQKHENDKDKGTQKTQERGEIWLKWVNAWATVARASLERQCSEIEEIMDTIERKCVEGNATWSYITQKNKLLREIEVDAPIELFYIEMVDMFFSTLVEMEINYASVSKLIHKGSDLADLLFQFVEPSEFTPLDLSIAARTGALSFVDYLLLNERFTGDDCLEALNGAIGEGNVAMVQRLMADDRCLVGTNHGNTALCVASSSGQLSVIDCLLADPRVIPLTNSSSPLWHAICGKQPLCLSRLLQDPRFDSSDLNGLFSFAASKGDLAILDFLMKVRDSSGSLRVDPTAHSLALCCPLISAISFTQLDAVNFLIEDCDVDPSINNNYALSLALCHSSYGRVRGFAKTADRSKKIADRLLKDTRVQQELRKRYSPQIIKKIEAGHLPNVLKAYHKLS